MSQMPLTWNAVESRSTLASEFHNRLQGELVTEDARAWGFFMMPDGCVLAVGYADLGLLPVAMRVNNRVFVGVDEVVACFDVNSLERIFSYRMPSVFHEFLSMDDPFVVRDELGFVALSASGHELWRFMVSGPIEFFIVENGRYRGETIDGDEFEFEAPGS